MSEWIETTLAPVCFWTISSRFGRPASRTCWRIALISLHPSWLFASCLSAGVNTPKLRTITRSSTILVLIRSGPRPTNSCWKAIISSLMAASALLCRRGVAAFICSAHLLWGCANDESRCRTAPLNPERGCSHRPCIRWPPRSTDRGGRRDVARLWLTAPCRPIRSRFAQDRTTRPGVPSFLSPTRLAVGFGLKELSPTLVGFAELAIHPADLLRGPCGSPAPRRHPGVRRPGYAVVTHRYTPRRAGCQHR